MDFDGGKCAFGIMYDSIDGLFEYYVSRVLGAYLLEDGFNQYAKIGLNRVYRCQKKNESNLIA